MTDGDMAYRLRLWRTAINDGQVYAAIDWLAQCEFLLGARGTAKSLRHPVLFGRSCQSLWGKTRALVARKRAT